MSVTEKNLLITDVLVKFCFIQYQDLLGLKMVFRPQFFKISRPSKAKTKNKTALTKAKTSENGLKASLKDYISVTFSIKV